MDKIHKDKGCKIYDCCVNQKKLKHCELCSKLPCKNFDEKDLTKTDEENEKNHQIQYIICVFWIIRFIIRVSVDYIKYNSIINSAPFYLFIIKRIIEFIVPSIIIFVVARIIKKKYNQ